jgi:hypothetical protein
MRLVRGAYGLPTLGAEQGVTRIVNALVLL